MDDSGLNKSLPITAAVMAVGSAGFLFYHLSAKRRNKEAYRKEKLSIKRHQLEMLKDTKNSVSAVMKQMIHKQEPYNAVKGCKANSNQRGRWLTDVRKALECIPYWAMRQYSNKY